MFFPRREAYKRKSASTIEEELLNENSEIKIVAEDEQVKNHQNYGIWKNCPTEFRRIISQAKKYCRRKLEDA